jgi:hypothetical protein
LKTEKTSLAEAKTKTFIGSPGFDRILAVLVYCFVGGLFVDGWAHAHGRVDNTFFTPWHAILYSGYFACAICLIGVTLVNHSRGYSWQKSIPQGYALSLFGAPLFITAGAGDLVWHTLFGFEVGIEPLLSPSHLLLAFSASLMITGPLRSTWLRATPNINQNWSTLLPALLSLSAFLAVLTFFTEFVHPTVYTSLVTNEFADGAKARGVGAILLQTILLMGTLMIVMRRWRMPLGSFTLLITLNVAFMTVLTDSYILIPAAFVTGILADILFWRLRPSSENVGALRIFAFVVPVVYYLLYFAALGLTEGISWSIHLWLGSTVMAGVASMLLSYLLVAPKGPMSDTPIAE